MGLDIAILVEVELAGEHGGIGDVSDAEEDAGDGENRPDAGFGIENAEAGNGFFFDAEDFFDGGVGEESDLRMGDGAVEHDARGAEVFAAVNEGDFAGEAGEEERFLHSGVAAADDGDFVAGEKEAVAGGAGADAVSDEGLFGGQAEPARGGSAGNDESAGVDDLVAAVEDEGVLREVGGVEMAEAEFCAEAGGLLAHVLDELGALDAFRPAGEIFDEGGDGELAAGLVSFKDEGAEVGTGRVDGGGEAGAAGAKNDGVADSICHVYLNFRLYLRERFPMLETHCTAALGLSVPGRLVGPFR